MQLLVRFLSNFLWFCRHWHPVSIRWKSPRILWRMAMKREAIKAAVLRSHAKIEADETNAKIDIKNSYTELSGATVSAFDHLRMYNHIVAQIIRAGGTAEDCAVALSVANDELIDRIMLLEGIAPRKYRLPDGRVMVWRCPDELVPETDIFISPTKEVDRDKQSKAE